MGVRAAIVSPVVFLELAQGVAELDENFVAAEHLGYALEVLRGFIYSDGGRAPDGEEIRVRLNRFYLEAGNRGRPLCEAVLMVLYGIWEKNE